MTCVQNFQENDKLGRGASPKIDILWKVLHANHFGVVRPGSARFAKS